MRFTTLYVTPYPCIEKKSITSSLHPCNKPLSLLLLIQQSHPKEQGSNKFYQFQLVLITCSFETFQSPLPANGAPYKGLSIDLLADDSTEKKAYVSHSNPFLSFRTSRSEKG